MLVRAGTLVGRVERVLCCTGIAVVGSGMV